MTSAIAAEQRRPDCLPADDDVLAAIRSLPAQQQPDWSDRQGADRARADLARLPALVGRDEVWVLRRLLAEVSTGRSQVVQAGDCAEDPADCRPRELTRRIGLLDALAGTMRVNTGKPVLRVGRLAGQFAKPRSQPYERCGDLDLPVYRGHLVNAPEPDPVSRRADPERMLAGYHASESALRFLRGDDSDVALPVPEVWTSHEALVLDYELPLVRRDDEGRMLLTSTHWPWIGDRTRQLGGAHVALLASVVNPVACKVGPSVTAAELSALCDRLDPRREPGRLTLIARLGADRVGDRLPALVAAVRAAGHPAIWLCDPMHGNTVATPDGRKTRFLSAVTREVREFQRVVSLSGGVPGGLHLETTPDAVTECVASESDIARIENSYRSLCDPRLNLRQAIAVADAWGARPHHPAS